jgi:hypothetical protein
MMLLPTTTAAIGLLLTIMMMVVATIFMAIPLLELPTTKKEEELFQSTHPKLGRRLR